MILEGTEIPDETVLTSKLTMIEALKEAYEPAAFFFHTFHALSVANGWWHDKEGNKLNRNVPEMLCLIHSEISEAMEGFRKGKKDDHLPDRPAIEVELADAVIRICDLAYGLDLDLVGAIIAKAEYNNNRLDHKREHREGVNGKKF